MKILYYDKGGKTIKYGVVKNHSNNVSALVHANFYSLRKLTALDCINDTLNLLLRVVFQVISMVCVDIFVCLSGWFGIKPTIKGFCSHWFIRFDCSKRLFGID